MVYLTRREHFSASHRLFNPKYSDEKNLEIYGKCAYTNGHGHNYEIEVTVAGEPSGETGMIMDLKRLSDLIETEILTKVDHKHLNFDVDFLQGIIPTAENISIAFWNILCPKVTSGKLFSVKVFETPDNFAEYHG